jgi:hypothetical protein
MWPYSGAGSDSGELPREDGETPTTDRGCWQNVDAGTHFKFRSSTYLADKVKEPSEPAVFEGISIAILDEPVPQMHFAAGYRQLREFFARHPSEEFLVIVPDRHCGGDAARGPRRKAYSAA